MKLMVDALNLIAVLFHTGMVLLFVWLLFLLVTVMIDHIAKSPSLPPWLR